MRAPSPRQQALTAARQRAEALVAQMTLEEKVGALTKIYYSDRSQSAAEICDDAPNGASAVGRLGLHRSPGDTARFVQEVRQCLTANSRLRIPPFVIDEGLHGLMQEYATSFPQAIALAASFDPVLNQRVFSVVAREARSRGTHWILSPVLDLARDPRWGRTDETYGEDPWLAAQMGAAAIRGLQGDHLPFDSQHVMATAKHFAGHGQPENGTNAGPANVSLRILRDELLLPFEVAVREARVGAVMASYNEIDAIPSHVNSWLLTDVLRKEWGFDGLVTSDGGAIPELVELHHVAANSGEASRRSLQAGVDFELGNAFLSLNQEVVARRLSESALNRAVVRVLTAKVLLGLFEPAPLSPEVAERENGSAEHQLLALEAARESAVLLANDGILPLDRGRLRRIAVVGPNADTLHLGSYSVDPHRGDSLLEGIRRLAGPRLTVVHAPGCRITDPELGYHGWWVDEVTEASPEQNAKLIEQAVRVVRGADIAILAIGETESTSREAWSAKHRGDRDSLELLGQQGELVRRVASTGVPVVLVVINGRPLALGEAERHARATLETFYLGEKSGQAIAEILFGEVNPSGHLPISIPRHVGQIPVYYNHRPSARRGYLFSSAEPLHPFGWGLSYTTFSHSAPQLSPSQIHEGGRATLSLTVRNDGPRTGTDVVQMYISDKLASITRPVRWLRDFARITLEPGESREVTFDIDAADLAFWSNDLGRQVEPGLFGIEVGSNSRELTETTLEVLPWTPEASTAPHPPSWRKPPAVDAGLSN